MDVTKLALFLAVVGLLITREYQPPGAFGPAVSRLVADAFDFIDWEAKTLAIKGAADCRARHRIIWTKRAANRIVLDYVELVQRILHLEDQIDEHLC